MTEERLPREKIVEGLKMIVANDKILRRMDYYAMICKEALALIDAPPAVWTYYTNDEGKARWKCSACGKICKRRPTDKRHCSRCGKPMRMER